MLEYHVTVGPNLSLDWNKVLHEHTEQRSLVQEEWLKQIDSVLPPKCRCSFLLSFSDCCPDRDITDIFLKNALHLEKKDFVSYFLYFFNRHRPDLSKIQSKQLVYMKILDYLKQTFDPRPDLPDPEDKEKLFDILVDVVDESGKEQLFQEGLSLLTPRDTDLLRSLYRLCPHKKEMLLKIQETFDAMAFPFAILRQEES